MSEDEALAFAWRVLPRATVVTMLRDPIDRMR